MPSGNTMETTVHGVTHIVAGPISDVGSDGWSRSLHIYSRSGTHLEITAYADDPRTLEVQAIEEWQGIHESKAAL